MEEEIKSTQTDTTEIIHDMLDTTQPISVETSKKPPKRKGSGLFNITKTLSSTALKVASVSPRSSPRRESVKKSKSKDKCDTSKNTNDTENAHKVENSDSENILSNASENTSLTEPITPSDASKESTTTASPNTLQKEDTTNVALFEFMTMDRTGLIDHRENKEDNDEVDTRDNPKREDKTVADLLCIILESTQLLAKEQLLFFEEQRRFQIKCDKKITELQNKCSKIERKSNETLEIVKSFDNMNEVSSKMHEIMELQKTLASCMQTSLTGIKTIIESSEKKRTNELYNMSVTHNAARLQHLEMRKSFNKTFEK